MVKKCENCGKEFTACEAHRKYCSQECAQAGAKGKKSGHSKWKKKHVSTESELVRLANEAAAHGMTYGKYIEWLEKQKKVGGSVD